MGASRSLGLFTMFLLGVCLLASTAFGQYASRMLSLFLLAFAFLTGCGPTAAERQRLAAQEAEAEARRQREHQEYLRAKDEFVAAERVGTIKGYEELLARSPSSPFAPEARRRIEAMQFSQYSNRGTIEDYEAFLREYPEHSW